MIAVSCRMVTRQCDIGVSPGCLKASRGLPADRRETPAIQPEFETWRGAACGCNGINRSTQRRAAHAERIGAAIYFDPLAHLRVKFVDVAIVVRMVDGNAILQQRNAPHMINAADAGAANRRAHLMPKPRTRLDAGRAGQT